MGNGELLDQMAHGQEWLGCFKKRKLIYVTSVIRSMGLIHVCLYGCSNAHVFMCKMPDCVAELPDTQTSQQTDVNEIYLIIVVCIALV